MADATATIDVRALGIPEMTRLLKAVTNMLLYIDAHYVITADSPDMVELHDAAVALSELRAGESVD